MSFYTNYAFELVRRYTSCRIHVGFEEYTSYKSTKEDGPWLIGYGSKKIGRQTVTPFTKVTRREIDEQLKKDLEIFSEYVADLIYMPLNEKKRGAVLSYAESVGLVYFKECRLLELIKGNASKTEIIKEWSPFMRKNYQSNTNLRDRRRSEKLWRKNKLTVHYWVYQESCEKVKEEVKKAKTKFTFDLVLDL